MAAANQGVARRWVFPIARIVVFAAIAAALVKLAFFSGATAGTDQLAPSGALIEPTVVVERGTINNDVSLQATVAADPAVPVRSSVAGEITKVSATVGQTVDAGTAIAVVKQTTTTTATTNQTVTDPTTGASSTQPVETTKTSTKLVTITAGAAGTVSSLTALLGQQLAVGDTIAQIAPPTFNVSGTIAAIDQYRLLAKPTEAKVTIVNGPPPFTCTGLTISVPLAGAESGGANGASSASQGSGASSGTASSGATSGGPTVRCAVPSSVTVFAGLAAKLVITAGTASDALLVPATAVEGAGSDGNVYVAGKSGGDPVAKPVKLGITNGTKVQIISGVAEGDEVLEFVPSKAEQQNQNSGTSSSGSGG